MKIYILIIAIAVLIATQGFAQQFTITGTSVDSSKVKITGFKQKPDPVIAQTKQLGTTVNPAPMPIDKSSSYATYSTSPVPAKSGIIITDDMGIDKPKSKNYNISSVRGLAEACRNVILAQRGDKYDERGYGLCFGYLRGVKNSYDIQDKVHGKGKICFPKKVTWLQIIKVYLKWADNHPERLHRIAWEGVVLSMKEYFRC